MAKNYSLQYLEVLKNMLEDASIEVLDLMKKVNTGEPDGPSTARRELKAAMQKIDTRFRQLQVDARNMNYSEFKTKYIEHL